MTSAAQQNAMMLASLLGIDEAEAGERLDRFVLLTAEGGWKASFASEVAAIVGRTLNATAGTTAATPDLEVVIGAASPRTNGPHLFADLGETGFAVSFEPVRRQRGTPHGLYAQAAACAVAAAAVHTALGEAGLPNVEIPARFEFAQLGVPAGALDRPIEFHDAVMAGAGAVAHGFLRAARHLPLSGELAIVDPKSVQAGVLNRCLYLEDNDLNEDKATALAARAQPHFPTLRLTPKVDDFASTVRTLGRPPETALVTVDSRRVRRSIQLEAPHRIVDASTTDVRGVIIHSNTLPTANACLACIYRHVPEEHAREQSIADGLCVGLADVKQGIISAEIAARIVRTHSSLTTEKITGLALDSLFRQLCSEQALATPEGRQVLAPFAFVSAWAGVLMAVEVLRSFHGVDHTNYWSVDPWSLPRARGRMLRPRHPDCQFCSAAEFAPVVEALWGLPKAA